MHLPQPLGYVLNKLVWVAIQLDLVNVTSPYIKQIPGNVSTVYLAGVWYSSHPFTERLTY